MRVVHKRTSWEVVGDDYVVTWHADDGMTHEVRLPVRDCSIVMGLDGLTLTYTRPDQGRPMLDRRHRGDDWEAP